MPSEPLIALALSLLISLAPFLPAAEKSAPEEEPARVVEEQPALSAEQLAALAQTPASWFDEPALLDALSKLPHYDETRAQRYLAYRTGGVWTLEQVLRIVNTDNDLPRFTAAVDADPDDGDLILVNKYSRLASDYVPEDLTDSIHTRKDGRDTQQLRLYAAKALEAFLAEAAEYGHTDVTVTSAYRSYAYQNYLFNVYCDNERKAHPDASDAEIEAIVLTYSLKPGMSEHQSGLCVDMHNLPSANISFGETAQAKWLAENAHRFGFILRFPADKTDITGVQYEPWHFRFVGREAATEIYEQGLCLEEYLGQTG